MEMFYKRKADSISEPEINLNSLPRDPAKRKKISEYHPNQRDEVRRRYLAEGPCKPPMSHPFPKKDDRKITEKI